MDRVKIDALALLILGSMLNLRRCSSCSMSHSHVYRVHYFYFKFHCTLSMVLKALRRQGVQGGTLTSRRRLGGRLRRLGAQGGQFCKAEVQRLDA
jgi:hypothetical protein